MSLHSKKLNLLSMKGSASKSVLIFHVVLGFWHHIHCIVIIVFSRAQSGTGKTATFSISILQCLDTQVRETQALVLSPTRELANQIQKVVLALGDYMSVQCHACIGGTSIGEDIRKLDYGQHVVSGTPGRVFGKISQSLSFITNISCITALSFSC